MPLPDDEGMNLIWLAYKKEIDHHQRMVAVRLILEDLGLVCCRMLRSLDSCEEKIKMLEKIA